MNDQCMTVGRSLPRIDAVEKVTGNARFAPDLKMEGMLHARLLRSPHAHARVTGIDTSRAKTLPGVRAIATIEEVPKVIN
ncbi:4-hydroxybenzoyl-CoA reductase subunit alpha, partial [Thermodesulfobacteriota bacterium]